MNERVGQEELNFQVQRLNDLDFHWNLPGSDGERGLIIANSGEGRDVAIVLEPETIDLVERRRKLVPVPDGKIGLPTVEGWYHEKFRLTHSSYEHYIKIVPFRVDSTIHAIEASRVLEQRREPNFEK